MSRCFPYRHPGYEKKARIDDTDLIIKETHKEKKDKKGKPEKEKREGKEKRDEETSKEKHREKDRKEKHREKKDKDKEKEKNRTLAEKRVEGQQECNNGDNLGPNRQKNAEIMDSDYVLDLARRIMDEHTAMGQQLDRKISVQDQRGAEPLGRVEKKIFDKQSKEKEETKHKKDIKKVNGFRDHIDARGFEKAVVQHLSGLDTVPMARKNGEEQMEGKDKSKNGETYVNMRGLEIQIVQDFSGTKRVEQNTRQMKQMEGKEKNEYRIDVRGLENAVVQDLSRMEKKKGEHNSKSAEKKIDMKRVEGKENNYHKQSQRNDEKRKDREWEKKTKGKDIEKERKEKTELSIEHPKSKGIRNDALDTCIIDPSQLIKETAKNNAGEEYLGKRKKLEPNGYLHDNDIQPNKLPRLVSSSPLAMENGRKLDLYQTAIQMDSEIQGNDPKVNIKEHRTNGLVDAQQRSLLEAQQHSVHSTRDSSATEHVSVNGDTLEKLPHPDINFLREILYVPTMQEWSDFDEQEWLFGSKPHSIKEFKVGSPDPGVTQQVWAEALHIEDAGVCALPYVIPY